MSQSYRAECVRPGKYHTLLRVWVTNDENNDDPIHEMCAHWFLHPLTLDHEMDALLIGTGWELVGPRRYTTTGWHQSVAPIL
jgi:hypothetical protein